jgi:methyl-accepting chemotaxis protein
MTAQAFQLDQTSKYRLTRAAATLGYEIVDIEGFLELVEIHAKAQRKGLDLLTSRASDVETANADVRKAVLAMVDVTQETVSDVQSSAKLVRDSTGNSQQVAGWVQGLAVRTREVSETLAAVKKNNTQIASIATQVTTLAINAKIEAARAGEAGRGFAVVAEAINDLSRKTRDAAIEISSNIEALSHWMSTLGVEAEKVAVEATGVLETSGGTDAALTRMEMLIGAANKEAQRISLQSERVQAAMADFGPALSKIDEAVKSTTGGVAQTHQRILRLIDTSETIVQSTVHLGGGESDTRFIAAVQGAAAQIAKQMEAALASGQMSMSRLFDTNYRPIPDTNPEQYMTEATGFLDRILPPIQEPVLALDPLVVFCAAVDRNGYLPTHNLKFSKPPSDDPVWNTANCRNRRIFNDRVGSKAGKNKDPFLLQVYRRDMGGGQFKMMKDLSAPIVVQGRHWGGLRLAYAFE